jgi:spermidine synthase
MISHSRSKSLFATAVFLGFTSVVTQIALLREFLGVFSGNELVIGIVLANWMILTGFGAYLGKYPAGAAPAWEWILALQLLLAGIPVAVIFLLNHARNSFFLSGTMIGIAESWYLSFVLLLPFCIPAGYQFTILCRALSANRHENLVAKVYAMEATGSVLGGLLVNLLAIRLLGNYQILLIAAAMNTIAVALLARAVRSRSRWLIACAIVGLAGVTTLLGWGGSAPGVHYAGQSVLFKKDTPFGTLAITRQEEQLNFFENNILLFSSNDPASVEEFVHFGMLQHPAPMRVLLVGGGVAGAPAEILKYQAESIDYLELNPFLVEAGRRFTNALDDGRIRVYTGDPRQFIRRTTTLYDVALIQAPDPVTVQFNRYYTREFLREVKSKLTPDGIVSLSLLPGSDYLGPDARDVSSVFYRTLRSVFSQTLIVPGLRNYYIGSERALDIRIGKLATERRIANAYVNDKYVDDTSLASRSAALMRSLVTVGDLNLDFRPLAYFRQISYWLSYFQADSRLIGVLLAVMMMIAAVRLDVISLGVFLAGMAGSSAEFLLIFSFQVVLGYVYQFMGLIITAFMASLAVGAWFARRRSGQATIGRFIALLSLLGLLLGMLPWCVMPLRSGDYSEFLIQMIILLLTMVIAGLVGVLFAHATLLLQRDISSLAARLYGVDLLGSAIGMLAISMFLLPLLGMINACVIVGSVCLGGALIGYLRTNHAR